MNKFIHLDLCKEFNHKTILEEQNQTKKTR
jgi:hypothetical protein